MAAPALHSITAAQPCRHSEAQSPPRSCACRHGRGKFAAGNLRYEGEWQEGRQHGQGAMQTEGGDKYVGEQTEGAVAGGTSGGKRERLLEGGGWCVGKRAGATTE